MGCSNEDWAVFWCSLLSPLRLGEIPERRRERYFQQLSQEERLLPDGQRNRISARTLAPPVAAAERGRRARLVSPAPQRPGKAAEESRRDVGPRRGAEKGAAAPLPQSHQSHPEAGVRKPGPAFHPLSAPAAARGHAAETGRLQGESPLPLDPGPARGVVGRRLRARPAGDAPGPVREDASFRLDRLPQPLRRRGPVLRPREPGHPRRFAVAGLGKSRCQPRTVRGQRQDLPRQGPATGLHPAQHPALAPAATRSSGRRPDRTLHPDLPNAIGGGSPGRRGPHPGRPQPRLGGLARRGLPPGGP